MWVPQIKTGIGPLASLFSLSSSLRLRTDKGRALPKFGEWDVNDPASAEGFTVIFNKARNERRSGSKVHTPSKDDNTRYKHQVVLGKPQSKKWFCCIKASTES
ncbi:hypothetical protein VNO77_29574 [Canavalia gladiata]|uniref:RIN4 pathogenic type III effector avirulence factor Avr cleavage site domain-containing protein n=1 Tax=Canavalia gladiata TaxID=3824 RepID=A0AAN9KQ22_CANGL